MHISRRQNKIGQLNKIWRPLENTWL